MDGRGRNKPWPGDNLSAVSA